MTVFLNGQPAEIDAATVEQVVDALKLPPRAVLVEHNGLALHRREWPDRSVSEGDRLEVLRVVAGG